MHFHGLGGPASSRSEWLGASRVRKTFPSGYGSPEATPRENGSAEDFGGAATALNPRDEEKTGAAANDNVPLINGRWFKDALSMRGNCGPSLGLSETSPSGRVNLWSRSVGRGERSRLPAIVPRARLCQRVARRRAGFECPVQIALGEAALRGSIEHKAHPMGRFEGNRDFVLLRSSF